MIESLRWNERSAWIAVALSLATAAAWMALLSALLVARIHPDVPAVLAAGRALAKAALVVAQGS